MIEEKKEFENEVFKVLNLQTQIECQSIQIMFLNRICRLLRLAIEDQQKQIEEIRRNK